MSMFLPDWLFLRELADIRARNEELLRLIAEHFKDAERVVVIDLGSGTGSTLRETSDALPEMQDWILVDHDRNLLNETKVALSRWCDRAIFNPPPPIYVKHGRAHRLTLLQADLAKDLEALLSANSPKPDLITASALLDLTSQSWLDRLASLLTERRLPFYAALSYDGQQEWHPRHAMDDRIISAFNHHQRRDKGFGPALGPDAASYLAARLSAAGFRVEARPSSWRLAPTKEEDEPLAYADHMLIQRLAESTANAVRELGSIAEALISEWDFNRRHAERCIIGHIDFLALPPRETAI